MEQKIPQQQTQQGADSLFHILIYSFNHILDDFLYDLQISQVHIFIVNKTPGPPFKKPEQYETTHTRDQCLM